MPRQPGRSGVEWETPKDHFHWDHVAIEVLMDIRAELRRLNALLHCGNFTAIPHILRDIKTAASRPRRRRVTRKRAK